MAPRWGWLVVLLGAALFSASLSFAAQPSTPPAAQKPPAPASPDPSEPAVSLATGTADELERQGDVYRKQKRFLDAIDYYDAAIAKHPSALLYNKRGMSLLFVQRNKDAKKSFEQALKLDKNSPEALNNLGYMAQLDKRYTKALQLYQKALAIRPNSATFHYNMGAAYFAKHDFDKAAAEYRTSFQLDPEIFQRVSRMGVMVQSSSPEDRAAFDFMVAKMYAQAGDLDNCLTYLRKAMENGYKDINQVYKANEFATLRTDPRFTELMSQKPQAIQ